MKISEKLRGIAFLTCASMFGTQPAIGQISPASETAEREVLFIGNSYTYYNNLMAMVEAIAAANRCHLRTARVTIPGGSLGQHWNSGAALDSIHARQWDHVVLQEQSLLGGIHLDGEPVIAAPDTFHAYATRFEREITAAGSDMVVLLTWARESKPEDQAALDHAYFSIGRSLGALVSPVGTAWAEILRQQSDIDLHGSDGSHPSAKGTFLTAAVLVRTLCPGVTMLSTPDTITYDSIDGLGRVLPAEQVRLALASDLRQRLVRAAVHAVDSVRVAGGYLPTEPVPPPTLPTPPAGRMPSDAALVGRWRGDVELNVPGAVELQIVENSSSHLSGSIDIRLGRSEYHLDLPHMPLDDGRFSLDVPLGEGMGMYFRLEGAYVGDAIAGVGRLAIGERTRAIGHIRLTRDGESEGAR